MTRNFLLSILLSLFIFADAYCWTIKKYDVDINIEQNSDLTIMETIIVDFQFENKHGIFRDIPIVFIDPTGNKHKIEINEIFVTDEKFNTLRTKLSKRENNLRIRIGDPEKFVSGIQHYVIRYRVKYALYSLSNIDELYWNAIGTGWAVPILEGTVRVNLPFETSFIQSSCYTGVYGSRAKECTIKREGNSLIFTANRVLSPHEGMTVAVGWPSGLIKIRTGPPWWKNPWIYTAIYILSLLSFLFFTWWTKGRDIGGRGILQVQYEPPEDLTPIEAGTLIDERLDSRDIVAEIIDMARRGYLRIIETKVEKFLFLKGQDYIFELTKEFDSDIKSKPYDYRILLTIFGGGKKCKLSDLKKKFYTSIPEIKKSVFQSLTKKGYFAENPLSIRNKYSLAAFIVFFLTIGGTLFFGVTKPTPPFPLLVAGLVTVFSLLFFGQIMPRKTNRGTLMKEYLRGYEEFISRVERDVIERIFPPGRIPEVFEKTLPYAIAFGEAEKWTRAFEGLFTKPPDWYHGRDSFSVSSFVNSINDFTNEASQILSSAPRTSGSGSGGGGFSGGGGGGGGGGSW